MGRSQPMIEALEELLKSCEEFERDPLEHRGAAALLILKGLIKILLLREKAR